VCATLSGVPTSVEVKATGGDVLADADLQIALWMLYEQHYTGFGDAAASLEWDPDLLAIRREIEDLLLEELRVRTADLVRSAQDPDRPLAERLFAMTDDADGPAVAAYVRRGATREQVAELLVHRSIYNLRETDPQLFALPRLDGAAKVALTELVYDEMGAGRPERLHSRLFARAMASVGLRTEPGGYVDVLPATTLAIVNVMHLFALRRELVAAAVGHFGAFEATSSTPSRQISAGARRLGLPDEVSAYFEEHVEADAVHEQLMFRDVCGGLVADHPEAEPLVLLGAASCLVVEAAAGEHLLEAWQAGRSSLLADDAGRSA
jgi:hypothetical protein